MFAALELLRLGTALVTAGCSSLARVGVVLGAALALSVMIRLSTSGGGWEFTVRESDIVALFMTRVDGCTVRGRRRVSGASQ